MPNKKLKNQINEKSFRNLIEQKVEKWIDSFGKCDGYNRGDNRYSVWEVAIDPTQKVLLLARLLLVRQETFRDQGELELRLSKDSTSDLKCNEYHHINNGINIPQLGHGSIAKCTNKKIPHCVVTLPGSMRKSFNKWVISLVSNPDVGENKFTSKEVLMQTLSIKAQGNHSLPKENENIEKVKEQITTKVTEIFAHQRDTDGLDHLGHYWENNPIVSSHLGSDNHSRMGLGVSSNNPSPDFIALVAGSTLGAVIFFIIVAVIIYCCYFSNSQEIDPSRTVVYRRNEKKKGDNGGASNHGVPQSKLELSTIAEESESGNSVSHTVV